LYGCESWTTTQQDSDRIQAAEINVLNRVKGCTKLEEFRNENIINDLQI
jgi:hypothetical protein